MATADEKGVFSLLLEGGRAIRRAEAAVGDGGYAKTHPCRGIYLKYWFIFIICAKGFLFRFPFLPLFSKPFDFVFSFLMSGLIY